MMKTKKMKTKKPVAVLITDTHLKEDNVLLIVNIFQQVIDYCKRKNIQNIFFLGDWFYFRSGQSLACQLFTRQIMEMLEESKIHTVFIPGNHDKRSLTDKASYLHAYITERDEYLELVDVYNRHLVKDVVLHTIPYFEEGEIYNNILKRVQFSKEKKNILLTHIGVNGVRNLDGTIVDNGVDIKSLKKFDKVFIGHYHDYSELNNGQIIYISSSHQANYGERIEDKGFTVLYDDLSFKKVKTTFPEYRNIKIDANDKEVIRSFIESVEKGEFEDNKLRVTFTGSYSDLASLVDKLKFEKIGVDVRFENLVEQNIEEIVNGDTVTSFDKKEIIKQYILYSKQNNFTSLQKTSGLKLLSVM